MKNQNFVLMANRVKKEHVKKAQDIGKGNKSLGVRKALDNYKLKVTSEETKDTIININK